MQEDDEGQGRQEKVMRLSMDATLKMSVKERMEYVYANGLNSIPAEEAEALLKRADFDYWRTKK